MVYIICTKIMLWFTRTKIMVVFNILIISLIIVNIEILFIAVTHKNNFLFHGAKILIPYLNSISYTPCTYDFNFRSLFKVPSETGYVHIKASEVEEIVVTPQILEYGRGLHGSSHIAAEVFQNCTLPCSQFYVFSATCTGH